MGECSQLENSRVAPRGKRYQGHSRHLSDCAWSLGVSLSHWQVAALWEGSPGSWSPGLIAP